jgi:hypothetical protein
MTVKHMLPAVPEAADVLTAYELTHQSMQQFIVNTHTEWFNTIDNSISKQLQDNLLVQDKADRKYQASVCNPHVLVVRVSDAAPWDNAFNAYRSATAVVTSSHLSTVCDVS